MYLLNIILTLASVLQPAQSPNEKLIAEIIQKDLVAAKDATAIYEGTLSFITKRTKFENHWQINRGIKDGYLNVFVLKAGIRSQPNLPAGLKDVFGSCTYLGEKNIVVCDDAFVGTFLEKRNVRDMVRGQPDSEGEWKRHHESFLLWVLGHEIGHVVNAHGSAHFGPDNLEGEVASSSIGYQRELDADAFLAGHIGADKQVSLRVTRMILDLLNAEIRKQVGDDLPHGVGILFDYNNEKVVKYMRLRTHPEYVVRATRILQRLGSFKGNEALKAMTDAFAAHLKEGF